MNNVGTSDDSQTQFANYDSSGGGASYSNQALASAGLYAGHPFVFNGVRFDWSPSYSSVPDNYQASGQTFLLQHQARTPWPSWDRPPMAPLQG